MPTVAELERLQALVSRLTPLADVRRGELIRADDWNSLDSLLGKLQTRIYSDQPYTFLYESKRLAVHGPRIRGVRIDSPSDPLAQLEQVWVE